MNTTAFQRSEGQWTNPQKEKLVNSVVYSKKIYDMSFDVNEAYHRVRAKYGDIVDGLQRAVAFEMYMQKNK